MGVGLAIAKAQDPAKVDPAHYKVIFNNPQVRILDVRHKAGEKAIEIQTTEMIFFIVDYLLSSNARNPAPFRSTILSRRGLAVQGYKIATCQS